MSKRTFVERLNLEKPRLAARPANAPIVFLLGTSTAGKSTICDKVLEFDKGGQIALDVKCGESI